MKYLKEDGFPIYIWDNYNAIVTEWNMAQGTRGQIKKC